MLVGDPAARTAKWLYDGAPAGLQRKVDLQGICAEVEDESPELNDLALATDLLRLRTTKVSNRMKMQQQLYRAMWTKAISSSLTSMMM